MDYIENGAGQLESRIQNERFALERQNSDSFSVEATTDYELLVRPFTVSKGVVIAPGGYSFSDVTVAYAMGLQRRVSGTWTFQRGEFYNGTLTTPAGGRLLDDAAARAIGLRILAAHVRIGADAVQLHGSRLQLRNRAFVVKINRLFRF